jgi:glycosyltransferase involved in cell wall biosynthesis
MKEDQIQEATVSVIIPTSGRFELLPRALESLVNSQLKPAEVIIVTDSSIREAEQELESIRSAYSHRLENMVFIHSSGPSGAAATRNAGLQFVSSDYVAFLDDDDEFLPEKLTIQLQEMIATESVFSFSDYFRVSPSETTYADCSPKPKHNGDLAREISFDSCRIATPTVVVSSKILTQLAPLFPEDMTLREDNYAWLRIALTNNFRYVHISQALAKVNLEGASLQRPDDVKKIKPTPLITKEERKILSLARSGGLRAPFMHALRISTFRTLVLAVQAFRRRWPKKE